MWTQQYRAVVVALSILIYPLISVADELPVIRQANDTQAALIQQLVSGIDYNIMAQNGEKAVLSQMQSLVAAPTPVPMLVQAAKDDLLSFMACGARIRSNNMNLSVVNPEVTRGLAQLEATQVLQMAQANSLNGTVSDGPTLDSLQNQVDAAIQKNSMLQAIATSSA